ncbi:MAG: sulfatase [Acidobacteria bacterium]|nr:sulfatase [Acidobacteriota bacterium]
MSRPSRLFSPAVLGGLGLLLAAVSCRAPPQVDTPLFDALHRPLILTESQNIGWPASNEPNRFLQGWWDVATKGPPRLVALERARIQGVKLGDAGKALRITASIKPESGGSFEARVSGRKWKSFPLARRIQIPIPKNTPAGRFTVDFRLPDGSKLGVRRAEFLHPQPAGEVTVESKTLVQSGFSLVETVRRLESATVLSGRFRPPSPAAAGQHFALEIERSDGSKETVFEWSGDSRDAGDFEISIEAKDPWVRIRFLALGEGAPGRWSELTLRARETTVPESVPAPSPPKVVILYVMDALRSDFVGHLGGPNGITPTIDRLAEQGVTFRKHFSVAPNTVPSTKSLFTGQVFLYKGGHKLTPESGPTLAERFSNAGFRTGLFSGNGNVTPWRGMGRGFEKIASGVLWKGDDSRAITGYNNNAERIHAAALHWIGRQDPNDSLFLHIQAIHPHNPYAPPEPFLSTFAPDNDSKIDGRTATLLGILSRRIEVDEADQEKLRGLYAGGAAYNDAHIESFLEAVLERYPKEEVLFILTSDHGEELFEHGGVLHGYTLYDEMLHIPLVAWWPGTIQPGAIESLTDNLDLYSSIANLATPGGPITGGGNSLWPYLLNRRSGEATGREVVFASASAVRGGIFMARSPRYKFVYAPRLSSRRGGRWGMGQGRGRGYDGEYLFDMGGDPAEMTNLVGDNILEADWLQTRLMAWIKAGEALEAGEALDEMDEETRNSLRALGYLQ